MTEPKQQYSLWQAMSAALNVSLRAIDEVRALARQPGPKGDPGEPGKDGKLPQVRSWSRGISYEGSVVTSGGSLWQALRDTAEPPGHEDWALLAARGQDGHSPEPKGHFSPDEAYRRLDIVALDGGSFIALRDDPGPCPGDGWKLLVARGSRGKPGEKGDRGDPGPRGGDGIGIEGFVTNPDRFTLSIVRSDGHVTEVDLRPMFETYHRMVGG